MVSVLMPIKTTVVITNRPSGLGGAGFPLEWPDIPVMKGDPNKCLLKSSIHPWGGEEQ